MPIQQIPLIFEIGKNCCLLKERKRKDKKNFFLRREVKPLNQRLKLFIEGDNLLQDGNRSRH